jgi:hypothetical protein
MISISKDSVKKLYETELTFELNQVKDKIELYSKKYNSTFEQFESKVKNSEKENFEEWDDYMEWNAFQKSYQDLLQKKSDLENDNFKVS